MSRLKTIAMVLLLVAADKPLTPHETAARGFAFEGVRLGMTETALTRAKTTRRMPQDAMDKTGTYSVLRVETDAAQSIFATIYRGQIIRNRVVWDAAATARNGGEGNILKLVQAKFGKHHDSAQVKKITELQWTFAAVERTIELQSDESDDETYVRLTITDSTAWAAAKKEQAAKIKTGLE